MTFATKEAIQTILNEHAPNFSATVGLILGSGLASLADEIESPIKIPYDAFPDMPKSNVEGHASCFLLGKLEGQPIACMNGRLHHYEGTSNAAMKTLIRVFQVLGCETLVITNASGSMRKDLPPGNLMLISDHINMSFNIPLIGPNDDEFGPRFFPMDDAYDPELRATCLRLAESLGIPLIEGVYIGVAGPAFETPAEIRAFRTLGADAVGMSTVPDVLIARHCGMKVLAIATATNYACGMSEESLSHEGTLKMGKRASDDLQRLVRGLLATIV